MIYKNVKYFCSISYYTKVKHPFLSTYIITVLRSTFKPLCTLYIPNCKTDVSLTPFVKFVNINLM